ncbi:hypothetical protein SERLA73DRAFT_192352, partial [Serpula lacrymans var. lacrymans S7.3]
TRFQTSSLNLKFTTLLLVIQCGHNTSHCYHCYLLSSSLVIFESHCHPFRLESF